MSAEFVGGSRRFRRPVPAETSRRLNNHHQAPDAELGRAATQLPASQHAEDRKAAPPAVHTAQWLKLSTDLPSPATVVINVSGDVDLCSAPRLEELTLRNLERHEPELLILDLTAVGFIGTAGLLFLLRLQHDANCSGVDLQIVAPSRIVRRPIELLGLEKELNLTTCASYR